MPDYESFTLEVKDESGEVVFFARFAMPFKDGVFKGDPSMLFRAKLMDACSKSFFRRKK